MMGWDWGIERVSDVLELGRDLVLGLVWVVFRIDYFCK